MEKLNITAKLLQNDRQIMDLIMRQVKDKLNYMLQSAADSVQKLIVKEVGVRLENSPEINALINGDLAEQLGVQNPAPIVTEIVSTVQNSIQFTVDRVDIVNGFIASGGYTIEILQSDFQDILGVPNTAYVTKKGVDIPWLNWLLFAGDTPLIFGYRLVVDPTAGESRAGGMMIKAPGESWGIPSAYAGTATNNFLTRALVGIEDDITEIIQQALQKRI